MADLVDFVKNIYGENGEMRGLGPATDNLLEKGSLLNIYFAACFEKLMADCYISRHDFEMVNIHLEKAMKLSKANNLMFMQCRIYSLMGKAYYEIATTMADSKKENARNSYEMYKIALNIALG